MVLDDGTLALRVKVARQAVEMMSTTSAADFAAGTPEQRAELLSGLLCTEFVVDLCRVDTERGQHYRIDAIARPRR